MTTFTFAGGIPLKITRLTKCLVALATCSTLFASSQVGFAQTTNAAPLSQSTLAALAPHGTTVVKSQTWTENGQEWAIAVTKWSLTQPTPWMIIAKRTAARSWDPVFIAQAQQAFAVQKIVVGPRIHNGTIVSVSFIVDAATGLISHIYTLQVDANGVHIVSNLPGVVAMTALKPQGDTLLIEGLNLQLTESLKGSKWVMRETPLRTLLSKTTHPIGFVMGWTLIGGKEVKRISLVGPDVIHAKVGSQMSFVPLNSQASNHMLGGSPKVNGFSGISVFAASPGQSLQFYQAAELFGNTVTFTTPGTFTYGIVPPDFRPMTPNDQTAIVTVQVSK